MKNKVLFILIPGMIAMVWLTLNLLAAGKDQTTIVNLREDLNAAGVTLKAGRYLVIHQNHEAGESGKACLFFYNPPVRSEKNEVAKFRCKLVSGEPAKGFAMKTLRQADGTFAVRSLQFSGSSEIHQLESAN